MSVVNKLLVDLTGAAEINELVGNTANQDWKFLLGQNKIIQGELDEMHENVLFGNIAGMQDDTADVLFTLVGQIYRSGLWNNFLNDWNNVVASQWSKFDDSEEEWLKTKALYDAANFEVYCEVKQDSSGKSWWITYSAKDQLDLKGRMASKGKWQKSHRFVEPNMSALASEVASKGIEFKAISTAIANGAESCSDINELYISELTTLLTAKWVDEKRVLRIVNTDGTKVALEDNDGAVTVHVYTVVTYVDKDDVEKKYKNIFSGPLELFKSFN